MSEDEFGSFPMIVRELLGHLPKDMDDELKMLVARAEEGEDTTFEIVDLFSKFEYTRLWLKENISVQSMEKGESNRLAGNQGLIPPSQKWVCPANPRKHWLMVMQEDEDAPMCPMCRKDHGKEKEMIRERKTKG